MNIPFAVFIVVAVADGFAATSRTADRGEAGRIGLPGGKIDAGENLIDAAIRESAEEGWRVSGVNPMPIHSAMVDDKPVVWLRASSAVMLAKYKEKHRLCPLVASRNEILSSGYGNENLPI